MSEAKEFVEAMEKLMASNTKLVGDMDSGYVYLTDGQKAAADTMKELVAENRRLRQEITKLRIRCGNLLYREYRKGKALEIKKVIFNPPATIVEWTDGTKTVVKAQNGEYYDAEKGLAMAIVKKVNGNTGKFNDIFHKWVDPWYTKATNEFKKWCEECLGIVAEEKKKSKKSNKGE